MPMVDATFRLSQDPQTALFTFAVEYKSDETGEEHQGNHRRIVEKAIEMLREYGLTRDQLEQTRIGITRITSSGEEQHYEPIPVPNTENQ